MFNFSTLLEAVHGGSSHDWANTLILLMIWWSSRGIKSEIKQFKINFEVRLKKIEDHIWPPQKENP